MFRYLMAINRSHFEDVRRTITRDSQVQIPAVLIVCALTFWAGHAYIAMFVATWVICMEFAANRMVNRQAPFQSLDRDQILLATLVMGCVCAVIYLIPSLYLAHDLSIALKVVAIIWVLGIQIHITNAWSRVPAFLYARLVPTFMMLILTIFQAAATSPARSTQIEWVFTLAFVFVFIYVSIETIRHHVDTQRDLVDAEAKATARAVQLEDSQRLDVLTGLLSRRAFDKALDVMLADQPMEDGHIGVFIINLNNFKPINDTYSHAAGDVVLESVADRLKEMVGFAGLVGRMGGDEFICAVCDLEDSNAALQLANDMAQIISRAVEWNGHHLKILASIGVSMTSTLAPNDPPTVSKLCSAADQAMNATKSSAKLEPVLYNPNQFKPRMAPLDKQALIEALSTGDLRLYYQPKINLQTGEIVGFEALARWHHPDGTTRNPEEFLPQINDIGLQGDLMTTNVRQVCTDIRTLINMGLDPGQVSLNLCAIALTTVNGRQELQTIIAANNDVAKYLTFEIPEGVFVARTADAIQTSIATFRGQGVRISLDDFGTGIASFHHLRKLDFDELKIDTSFIAGLGQDPDADVLVRGFHSIAKGLNVDVVAEGVETNAQKQALLAMGCQVGQGYLFSPAVHLDAAIALLTDQKAA